jgi:hypothetical protein
MNIYKHTLTEVISFTTIDNTEDIDKFDGIILTPEPNHETHSKDISNITLINTKARVKYFYNKDVELIKRLPLEIKSLSSYKGKYNSSILLIVLESAVHIDNLTSSFVTTSQIKIE